MHRVLQGVRIIGHFQWTRREIDPSDKNLETRSNWRKLRGHIDSNAKGKKLKERGKTTNIQEFRAKLGPNRWNQY